MLMRLPSNFRMIPICQDFVKIVSFMKYKTIKLRSLLILLHLRQCKPGLIGDGLLLLGWRVAGLGERPMQRNPRPRLEAIDHRLSIPYRGREWVLAPQAILFYRTQPPTATTPCQLRLRVERPVPQLLQLCVLILGECVLAKDCKDLLVLALLVCQHSSRLEDRLHHGGTVAFRSYVKAAKQYFQLAIVVGTQQQFTLISCLRGIAE